jgi:hypothetical protein
LSSIVPLVNRQSANRARHTRAPIERAQRASHVRWTTPHNRNDGWACPAQADSKQIRMLQFEGETQLRDERLTVRLMQSVAQRFRHRLGVMVAHGGQQERHMLEVEHAIFQRSAFW